MKRTLIKAVLLNSFEMYRVHRCMYMFQIWWNHFEVGGQPRPMLTNKFAPGILNNWVLKFNTFVSTKSYKNILSKFWIIGSSLVIKVWWYLFFIDIWTLGVKVTSSDDMYVYRGHKYSSNNEHRHGHLFQAKAKTYHYRESLHLRIAFITIWHHNGQRCEHIKPTLLPYLFVNSSTARMHSFLQRLK